MATAGAGSAVHLLTEATPRGGASPPPPPPSSDAPPSSRRAAAVHTHHTPSHPSSPPLLVVTIECLRQSVPGISALLLSTLLGKAAGIASFSASANVSHPDLRLYDVVHSRVPEHWDHTDPASLFYQAPDRLITISVCATILLIGTSVRNVEAMAAVVGEVTLLLALLFALRSVLIVATTVPTPVRSCLGATDLGDAQSGFAAAETFCNDLMYSGHTAFHLVLGSVWAASRTPALLKAAVACYVLGCVFVSVAVRDHYTMDVLVAAYVTVPLCLLRRPRMLDLFGHACCVGTSKQTAPHEHVG